MGLALYAIRDLKLVKPLDEWFDEHPDSYPEHEGQFVMSYAGWANQDDVFPGRAEGIEPDMVYEYDVDKSDDFSMGSYGTYGGFRGTVTRFAEANGIYEQFEPVCNFSDCDGYIGPIVSAQLADAFKNHREAYRVYLPCEEWVDESYIEVLLEYYDNMTEAFEIARNGGVVIFC